MRILFSTLQQNTFQQLFGNFIQCTLITLDFLLIPPTSTLPSLPPQKTPSQIYVTLILIRTWSHSQGPLKKPESVPLHHQKPSAVKNNPSSSLSQFLTTLVHRLLFRLLLFCGGRGERLSQKPLMFLILTCDSESLIPLQKKTKTKTFLAHIRKLQHRSWTLTWFHAMALITDINMVSSHSSDHGYHSALGGTGSPTGTRA